MSHHALLAASAFVTDIAVINSLLFLLLFVERLPMHSIVICLLLLKKLKLLL